MSLTCPPVMICGFNRADCLQKVLERVREARPDRLYLVLDAPRDNHPNDVTGNNACREVFSKVDWPCEVVRDYADKNMGCRGRMSSGITGFMNKWGEGIILEDDCIPHLDFFRFCAELLERYRCDTRIGSIVGMQEHPYLRGRETSYYFDRFSGSCGWATWKRAWDCYADSQKYWDEICDGGFLESVFPSRQQRSRISGWFDDTCRERNKSWATQWWLTNIVQHFLTIHASVNMITNVGYEGAHNIGKTAGVHDVAAQGMTFPLTHPHFVMPDVIDEAIVRSRYAQTSFIRRLINKFLRVTGLYTKGIS